MDPGKRIIVALDIDSRTEALRLVRQLQGKVGLFKVGNQLFTAEGPQLVKDIIEMGERVFLDLKFHDIPNTVVNAALVARSLHVSMITIHTSGGLKMMSAVMDMFSSPQPTLPPRPLVLGVTVLTSLGSEELKDVGYSLSIEDQVIRLAKLAQRAGLDGIVASPEEIRSLRSHLGSSFKIIAPGIRPAGGEKNDQNRVATPGFALKAGADYLVIGRPITASSNPAESVERIVDSMRTELKQEQGRKNDE
jgi:orotidine-5'-phosphate decarboxylase